MSRRRQGIFGITVGGIPDYLLWDDGTFWQDVDLTLWTWIEP